VNGGALWSSVLVFLLAALPKRMLEHLIRLEVKHLKALGKGLWWNLTHWDIFPKHQAGSFESRQSQEVALP
jgi:hypothetical protein